MYSIQKFASKPQGLLTWRMEINHGGIALKWPMVADGASQRNARRVLLTRATV
jgi:hypothetical protein